MGFRAPEREVARTHKTLTQNFKFRQRGTLFFINQSGYLQIKELRLRKVTIKTQAT